MWCPPLGESGHDAGEEFTTPPVVVPNPSAKERNTEQCSQRMWDRADEATNGSFRGLSSSDHEDDTAIPA